MIRAVPIRRAIPAALAVVGFLSVFACRGRSEVRSAAVPTPARTVPAPAASATFVGRQACANCHSDEDRRWTDSHHDLAMQEATPKTVLGNFENATFTHFGVKTTFFRKGDQYFVRTDGPDGQLHEYPVTYTFGVYPLQQYLIPFPGGRLQALNVVWDSRPKKDGGQRWFHLYPKEEVGHADFSCGATAKPSSISRRNLNAGVDVSRATSAHDRLWPFFTGRITLTSCARPSGTPPRRAEVAAGSSLPHTV